MSGSPLLRYRSRLTGEGGAILIQVVMAMVALVGFLALVVDYGVLLVARAQAQNAADGAALAAATALGFDTMATATGTAVAQQNAQAIASTVPIWGRTPQIDVAWVCNSVSSTPSSTACPAVPGLPPVPPRAFFGATVHVYADNAHGNAVPSYFAKVFGVLSQDVRAQATAAAAPANVGTCVWPLAIPDFWEDNTLPADDYQHNEYMPQLPGDDFYAPPQTYQNGVQITGGFNPTGIALTTNSTPSDSITADEQRLDEMLVHAPPGGALWPKIKRSHLVAVRVSGRGFLADLTTCSPGRRFIGERLDLDLTATPADALAGARTRWAADGGARWNPATYRIEGSCAGRSCAAAISPRLVLLPVFDPEAYDLTRNMAAPEITIVNFVGFFLNPTADPVTDGAIIGELSTYPGTIDRVRPIVRLQYSPLRTAVLTR